MAWSTLLTRLVPHRSRLATPLTLTAALCSGASALTLEVVWSKALVVPLGNSTDATALVLAGFMLGMAGGAWLGARIATRARRSLIFYALAELALALFACAVPGLIVQLALWVPPAWISNFPVLVFVVRACLALLLIVVPCFVMGATLPLLLAGRSNLSGDRLWVGVLYGINTLGAALASVAAGFYGVPQWGLAGCSRRAAVLSACAALLALCAAWLLRDVSQTADATDLPERTPQKTKSATVADDATLVDARAGARIALVIAFACGFSLLSAEVFWTRVLTFVFGHDTYAFATLLSVVVLGHALGGLIYARLAKRSALLVAAVGVSLTSLALLTSFYVAATLVVRGGNDPFGIGDRWLVSGNLSLEMLREWAYTPVLVLLPCVCSGVAYPASVSLYASARTRVATAVGMIGLINGLGAAAGALVTAFGLVSWLGIQGVATALSAFLALVVAACFVRVARVHGPRWLAGFPAFLVLVCAASAPHDLPKRMLHSVVGRRHQQFLYYEEARTATVSVIRNSINGERQLLVNAVNEVTTRLVHDQSFKLLGQLGPLLHENAKRGVMICLGAGLAAGSALSNPLERLDVVDLLAAVRRGAALFPEENNHVLSDPRLKLHVNDGRQYLLTTRDRYDVAIVDSTHPKSVDSWILYTQEFFELVRSRLNEGGIVVQWLPLHGLSEREFRAIVATFAAVFPQMTLWASVGYETYGQVGYAKLVGQRSSAPMHWDAARVAARLQLPSVQRDLARYGMGQLPEIIDQFVAGPDRIRQWTQGCPIHQDDRPFLGYLTELSRGPAMTANRLLAIREWPGAHMAQPGGENAESDAKLRRAFEAQGLVIAGQLEAAHALDPQGEKIRRYRDQADTSLTYYQALAARYPDDSARLFEAGTQLLSLGHTDVAATVFSTALQRFPRSLRLAINQGLLWLNTGEPQRAAERFAQLLLRHPGAALLNLNLGVALLAQGEANAAHQRLLLAIKADPGSLAATLALADAEAALGDLERAQGRLQALYRERNLDEPVVSRLAEVSVRLGDTARAQQYWAEAMRINPYRDTYAIEWARHLPPEQRQNAVLTLKRMRDLYPTNPAVMVALGEVDASGSHWSAASEAYLDVLDRDSRNVDATLGLAESLARQDRMQEAVDALCAAYRIGYRTTQIVSALSKLDASPKECTQDVRHAPRRHASSN